jgi:S1-C subfamily serine protease
MRRAAFPVMFLLLLLAPPALGQSLKGMRKEFARVGEKAIPATVVVKSAENTRPGGSTGVLIHEDGYVLSDADATVVMERGEGGKVTRRHTIDAIVKLPAPDHRSFAAVVLKRDEETDTTLLMITDKVKDLPFIPLGTSDSLKVGAFNITVGNAFGSGNEGKPALSLGCVSALMKREGLGGGKYQRFYTSAAVNPGSNGGPALDAEGHLVGIVSTWEREVTSPFRTLGIITPINRIRASYATLDCFAEVFPDPRLMKTRSDEAAVLEEAFAIIARHTYPSVVCIDVKRKEGTKLTKTINNPAARRDKNAPRRIEVPRYIGPYSGVVYAKDGLILTCEENLWAYKAIESITVHLTDGRSLPAKIRARDRYRQYALIEVEANDLIPLPPATKKDLEVGRFALAIGNPFGDQPQEAPLFTFGVVSNLHRLNKDMDAIQTDAGMVDSMVGGALVTLTGKFLGLNLMTNPEYYGRNSGIGFAIPLSAMEKSLPQLLRGTDVIPGYIGISTPSTNEKGEIVFTGVGPKGPAGKAGLLAKDRLLEVDGRKASRFAGVTEFIDYAKAKGPGKTLRLKVARGAGEKDLEIILGSPPER